MRCVTNDVSKIHIVDRHHPSAPPKKEGGSQTFTPSTIWFLFIAEAAQIKIRYFRDWSASKKRKSTSSGLRCCRRKWRNRWRTVHRWVPARPRPVWLLIWWSHRPPAVVAAMATKTNNRSSSSKGRNRTPSWVSRNRILAGLPWAYFFFTIFCSQNGMSSLSPDVHPPSEIALWSYLLFSMRQGEWRVFQLGHTFLLVCSKKAIQNIVVSCW